MDFANRIDSQQAEEQFTALYGLAAEQAPGRYHGMHGEFTRYYGDGPFRIFSAPGRTEIGGNHTDHNAGRVLAAAISMDTVAFCRANDSQWVRLRSQGYDQEFCVDLSSLDVVETEKGTTQALIRGIAAGMSAAGFSVGGFDAYVSSTVLSGSGLSSSAAFEVLMAAVFDGLFGRGDMDPVQRAILAQQTENVYFGKPCGLMDQSASSVGGLITIDFANPGHAVVEKVDFDFASTDYQVVVVNTGGSHAELTGEYASIRTEMEQVAACFHERVLRNVSQEEFFDRLPEIVGRTSHRAALRAMHFFGDNERVYRQVKALNGGDLEYFLEMVIESGESSWKLLQNCYVGGETHQGITLALAVSERLLRGQGAWRVHGGGFAGTILAFVPQSMLDVYIGTLDALFGEGSATALSIRGCGAIEVRI